MGQKKFDNGRWKKYLGSGKVLKQAINKYKKENFKRVIVYLASSKKELDYKEKELIGFFDAVQNEDWYNVAEGGTGLTFSNECNEELLKQRNNKISLALKRFWSSSDNKQMMRDSMSGKLSSMKGRKLTEKHKQGISQGNKGKKRSDEQLEKLKESQRRRWEKDEEREKISRRNKGKIPWNKGKVTPDDVRRKQSEAAKRRFQNKEEKEKIKNRKYINKCVACSKEFESRSNRTLRCQECKEVKINA